MYEQQIKEIYERCDSIKATIKKDPTAPFAKKSFTTCLVWWAANSGGKRLRNIWSQGAPLGDTWIGTHALACRIKLFSPSWPASGSVCETPTFIVRHPEGQF